MDTRALVFDTADFLGRVTTAVVRTPVAFINRRLLGPSVIHVEVGLIRAGTRLSGVATHCAVELRKAYLATADANDSQFKLRLRDRDILWNYPVSGIDRCKVERKLRNMISKKVDARLEHVDSNIGDDHIEIVFATKGI